MIKPGKIPSSATADRLLSLWASRYAPNLNGLFLNEQHLSASQLVELTSPEGRQNTAATVRRSLSIRCQQTELETNDLFAYIPNVVHLSEALEIARGSYQVYAQVLDIYCRQPPLKAFLRYFDDADRILQEIGRESLFLPFIGSLAAELEPTLMEVQRQHLSSKNSRAVGFMTTQFHLTTQAIIEPLSAGEQVLLSPYFQFVEEQVCIPWQRICAIAANYEPKSDHIALLETLITASRKIAVEVYYRLASEFARIPSRRGTLQTPDVRRSTVRDLTMMQSYLWLALLEQSTACIDQELYPLCRMVFPSIGVKANVLQRGIGLLIEHIHQRLTPRQQEQLRPYSESLQHLFVLWHSR